MVPRKQHEAAGTKRRIDTTKLILDPAARHVAFSKRRTTLFNMAGDLSALCGVDTAVIVFSPHGNPYAFGSPSVDAVLRQLPTDKGGEGGAAAHAIVDGEEAALIAAMRKELEDTREQVEVEKARIKARVELAKRAAGTPLWWQQVDVNALDAAELTVYEAALQETRDAVIRKINSLHADQNGA